MADQQRPLSIWCSLSFGDLIDSYKKIQSGLMVQVKALASRASVATPGRFLLLQFQMGQVTQIGDTISNVIAQIQSMINSSVRNQKTS